MYTKKYYSDKFNAYSHHIKVKIGSFVTRSILPYSHLKHRYQHTSSVSNLYKHILRCRYAFSYLLCMHDAAQEQLSPYGTNEIKGLLFVLHMYVQITKQNEKKKTFIRSDDEDIVWAKARNTCWIYQIQFFLMHQSSRSFYVNLCKVFHGRYCNYIVVFVGRWIRTDSIHIDKFILV